MIWPPAAGEGYEARVFPALAPWLLPAKGVTSPDVVPLPGGSVMDIACPARPFDVAVVVVLVLVVPDPYSLPAGELLTAVDPQDQLGGI